MWLSVAEKKKLRTAVAKRAEAKKKKAKKDAPNRFKKIYQANV